MNRHLAAGRRGGRGGLLLAPAAVAAAALDALGVGRAWFDEAAWLALAGGCAAPVVVYLVLERRRPRE